MNNNTIIAASARVETNRQSMGGFVGAFRLRRVRCLVIGLA